jgi:hypothetical protein
LALRACRDSSRAWLGSTPITGSPSSAGTSATERTRRWRIFYAHGNGPAEQQPDHRGQDAVEQQTRRGRLEAGVAWAST